MSFPRYPEYKDSGVEWLGEVPAHWEVLPLKRVSPQQTVGIVVNPSEYITDEGLPFIYGGDISEGRIDYISSRRISPENSQRNEKTCLKAGDLLTVRVGAPGITAVVPPECEGGNCASVMLVRRGEFNSDWLCFVMNSRAVRYQVEIVQYGAAQEQFNINHAVEFVVSKPPRTEQDAIATFLDRETAKIDTLVAEQEKLIALLQEKRQAVISHAVTKGLDPNVPMKDSGVEWLGEVPGHWEVCALRRVIAAIEQGWSPECYAREAEDQEWGVLKAGCLNGGNFRPSENKALPPELPPEEAYEVRVGDVLMSRASGSPELVGSTALVKATRERLMLSDKIFRLKLKEFVNAAFFVAALNSRPLRIQIENALSGGNGMANNLPQSSLLTFAMAVPPLAEQATITVFLEQETAKLDTLTAEARSAITLLQERRTALISAAVTGQIDVRGLVGGANAPDSIAASAYPESA